MKNVIALQTVVKEQKNEKSKATLRWNRIIIASALAIIVLGFSVFGIISGIKSLAGNLEVKAEEKLTTMFEKEVSSGQWNEEVAIEEVADTYLGLDIDENSKPEKFNLKKSGYEGYGFTVQLDETHPTYGGYSIDVWLYFDEEVGKFVPQFAPTK